MRGRSKGEQRCRGLRTAAGLVGTDKAVFFGTRWKPSDSSETSSLRTVDVAAVPAAQRASAGGVGTKSSWREP